MSEAPAAGGSGGPLAGRTVLVTRAPEHSAGLCDGLRARGAHVVEAAATRIDRLDPAPLHAALRRIHEFSWLVFTSRNAVRFFHDALVAAGLDARALAGVRIAAVGPATGDALLARGLTPDLTPSRFVAEGVMEALRAREDVRDTRVLYATAAGARSVIPDGLAAIGAEVERVHLYRTVPDPAGAAALRDAVAGGVDLVVFAAASAVEAFVAAVGADVARATPVASIGPVTSEAARRHGMTVVVEAAVSTGEGLLAAIEHHFAPRRAP